MMMNKSLILAKIVISRCFSKSYAIAISDLKHEVFDKAALCS